MKEDINKGLTEILKEVVAIFESDKNNFSDAEKCKKMEKLIEDLATNIQELQSIVHNKDEFKEGLIELNRWYLPDYIKLLQKHYTKSKKRRKKHKREEILRYFNDIKNDFKFKKDAILATANHFDITPQAVEKHLYNL